jgi:hypothetical protein
MSPSVETELTSLSEGFFTTIDTTKEGLLIRMRVLMFFQVLGQGEHFAAILAWESLHSTVDIVVTFQ